MIRIPSDKDDAFYATLAGERYRRGYNGTTLDARATLISESV